MGVKHLYLIFVLSLCFSLKSQNNLIPKPRQTELKEGFFEFNTETKLVYRFSLSKAQDRFLDFLEDESGLSLESIEIDDNLFNENAIYISEADHLEGSETYHIEISKEQIRLKL